MNKRLQIEHLARLLHLEVHIVASYDGALERLGEYAEKERLARLRGDHERHVLDITELLREMGEPAPPQMPESEALVAPALSALRNASSEEDVLQAVRMNEQVAAGQYRDARSWGVGLQVHELLQRHDEDEQRHVAAVEELLGAHSGTRRGG